jgi:hypothetical protein
MDPDLLLHIGIDLPMGEDKILLDQLVWMDHMACFVVEYRSGHHNMILELRFLPWVSIGRYHRHTSEFRDHMIHI